MAFDTCFISSNSCEFSNFKVDPGEPRQLADHSPQPAQASLSLKQVAVADSAGRVAGELCQVGVIHKCQTGVIRVGVIVI